MPLDLDDGFTLDGKTLGDDGMGNALPVVGFKYRPPLAPEMAAHRAALAKAIEPADAFEVRCSFLLARLVGWDVTLKGAPAPINRDMFRKLPDAIFIDLVNGCGVWKPKPTEEDAKGN